MIILPSKRILTSQPQGNAELIPSDGLVIAVVPGVSNTNLVDGVPLAPDDNGVLTFGASQLGIVTTSYGYKFKDGVHYDIAGEDFTLVMTIDPAGKNGWYAIAAGAHATDLTFGIGINGGTFAPIIYFNSSALNDAFAFPAVPLTRPFTLGVKIKQGVSCSVYLDGKHLGDTANTPASGISFGLYLIGTNWFSTDKIGNVGATYFWKKALLDSELLALTENPWKQLRQPEQSIYIPSSAGINNTSVSARLGQSGLLTASKTSIHSASGRIGSRGQVVAGRLASTTSAGRLGVKGIIAPVKISPSVIAGSLAARVQVTAAPYTVGTITTTVTAKASTSGAVTQAKISTQSAAAKHSTSGQSTRAKTSTQTAAGKLSARAQVVAAPFVAGTVTTTVAAKAGASGAIISAKLAQAGIVGKVSPNGQIIPLKIRSSSAVAKVSASSQNSVNKIGLSDITGKPSTSSHAASAKIVSFAIAANIKQHGQSQGSKTRQTTASGLLSLKSLLISGEFSIDRNLPSGEYGMLDVTPDRAITDVSPAYEIRKTA